MADWYDKVVSALGHDECRKDRLLGVLEQELDGLDALQGAVAVCVCLNRLPNGRRLCWPIDPAVIRFSSWAEPLEAGANTRGDGRPPWSRVGSESRRASAAASRTGTVEPMPGSRLRFPPSTEKVRWMRPGGSRF